MLNEPLIHFALGGALLFVLYALLSPEGRGGAERPGEIIVSAAQVEVLARAWERTWQRPPTPDELGGIIKEHIREEVYYREALALGLDRDDTIIRRRLRQKMEFMAEDFDLVGDPDDGDLEILLQAHPDLFRRPALVTFRHIYFSPDRRGEAALDDARRVLADLTSQTEASMPDSGDPDSANALGDPFFHQREFNSSPEADIARVFGAEFVPRLLGMTQGEWSGPVQSGFGYHLVRVDELVDGRVPALAEIREAVAREWQIAEREKAAEAFYQSLRAQYTVTIQMPGGFEPGDYEQDEQGEQDRRLGAAPR